MTTRSEREGAVKEVPAAKVRPQRVFEGICDHVRDQLSSGRLAPGDKLPAERDLATRLGSSRTAVREALRSLEMAGVLELRKGVKGGAFVRQGDPGVVTRSFGDMVHLGRISLEHLTESRVIIQDAVVRLACERATEEDLEALERSIDRTEELTRKPRDADRRVQLLSFYRVLAQATRNDVMVILVEALTDIVLTVLARESVVPKTDTVKAHREIVRLLRKRQVDKAAAVMSTHLRALHGHLPASAFRRLLPARTGDAKNTAKATVRTRERMA